MGKVLHFIRPNLPAANREIFRLQQNLQIERDQHDKTLATLTIASERIEAAGHILDACDMLFERITGFSPEEYLRLNK